MAIWQFVFGLVNDFNEETINKFKNDISSIYLINKSWSDKITIYGDLDGTCIEISEYDNNYEVDVRLDLRTISIFQLESILEIIKKFNLKILYREKMLEPDIYILKNKIVESKEFQCCQSPKQFFENL